MLASKIVKSFMVMKQVLTIERGTNPRFIALLSSRWRLQITALPLMKILPEWIAKYGSDSRKIGADEYWDELSVNCFEHTC